MRNFLYGKGDQTINHEGNFEDLQNLKLKVFYKKYFLCHIDINTNILLC
jgi:hypothetical protein